MNKWVKNKAVVPKSLSGLRADALAQRVRALASSDLSLIPRTYKVERKNQHLRTVL